MDERCFIGINWCSLMSATGRIDRIPVICTECSTPTSFPLIDSPEMKDLRSVAMILPNSVVSVHRCSSMSIWILATSSAWFT
jgi:hypothetical protein